MEEKTLTGLTDAEPVNIDKTSLYRKILAVMGEVQAVPKDKVNDFHKYAYTSEAAVIKAVRDAMVKHGLVAIPSIIHHEEKTDGKSTIATIHYCLKVVDIETGAYENVCVIGQGIDVGDKAYYKAITGANKYALMKLFQIPSTDDPEADIETDKRANQNRKTATVKGSNNSLITDAQKRFLEKLQNELQIDKQYLDDYILAKYGKDSIEKLSRKEASELINGLNQRGVDYLEDIELEESEDVF